ncbi:phage antirepressor Ant [Serratia liquefaciens]|nr:phage antirepressor Ant [Serratia liquefaciens]
MKNQLVPIFNGDICDDSTLLCDARNLHKFLGVGKHFSSWISERIAEYGFVENQDYVIASQIREAKIRGGHNRKDYHLTLDTAKELAMVERNEKGRQVRRYFIDCEKQLHSQVAVPPHKPTYVSCRVLHTYNEMGVIVSSQLARGDEMLTSPKGFIELMMRRQGL